MNEARTKEEKKKKRIRAWARAESNRHLNISYDILAATGVEPPLAPREKIPYKSYIINR